MTYEKEAKLMKEFLDSNMGWLRRLAKWFKKVDLSEYSDRQLIEIVKRACELCLEEQNIYGFETVLTGNTSALGNSDYWTTG